MYIVSVNLNIVLESQNKLNPGLNCQRSTNSLKSIVNSARFSSLILAWRTNKVILVFLLIRRPLQLMPLGISLFIVRDLIIFAMAKTCRQPTTCAYAFGISLDFV